MGESLKKWVPILLIGLGLVGGVFLGSWLGWPLSPKSNVVNTPIFVSEKIYDGHTRILERAKGDVSGFKALAVKTPGKIQRITTVELHPDRPGDIQVQAAVSDVGDGLGRVTVQAEGATVTGGQDLIVALPRTDYRHELSAGYKVQMDGPAKPGIGYAWSKNRAVLRVEGWYNPATRRPDEFAVMAGVRW